MIQKYIPGDWVKFKDRIAIVKEVTMSDFLLKEYYKDYDPNSEDSDAAYLYSEATLEEIEPILLTSKILEKNKWRLWEHHEREYYDDVSWDSYYNPALSKISLRFYPEEEAFFPYLYRESISEKPIKYVHQFQHLLFGLEINSEIKVTEE